MEHSQKSTRKVLLTSWDDGLHVDLRLGSLLADAGFKGTFYATTGPSGSRELRDQDLDHLVELGHEIGNHGWTHRDMTTLSSEEIIEEAAVGRREVERFMAPAPIIAPPCGFMNRNVVETLHGDGYYIRTAPIIGRGGVQGPIIQPTAQIYPHKRRRTVLHQLKHRTWAGWPTTRAWYGSRDVMGRLEQMLTQAEPPSVVHIWGHSSELERLVLWDGLERLLQTARSRGFEASTLGDFYARGAT